MFLTIYAALRFSFNIDLFVFLPTLFSYLCVLHLFLSVVIVIRYCSPSLPLIQPTHSLSLNLPFPLSCFIWCCQHFSLWWPIILVWFGVDAAATVLPHRVAWLWVMPVTWLKPDHAVFLPAYSWAVPNCWATDGKSLFVTFSNPAMLSSNHFKLFCSNPVINTNRKFLNKAHFSTSNIFTANELLLKWSPHCKKYRTCLCTTKFHNEQRANH